MNSKERFDLYPHERAPAQTKEKDEALETLIVEMTNRFVEIHCSSNLVSEVRALMRDAYDLGKSNDPIMDRELQKSP